MSRSSSATIAGLSTFARIGRLPRPYGSCWSTDPATSFRGAGASLGSDPRCAAEAPDREDEPDGPQPGADRSAPQRDRAQAPAARPHAASRRGSERRADRERIARHGERARRGGDAGQQRARAALDVRRRDAHRRVRRRPRQARAPGRPQQGAAAQRPRAPQRRGRLGRQPGGAGHARSGSCGRGRRWPASRW